MKTYILQLEQHDDIVSARDKMGWAKGGRVLLVWPEHGRALNRRLDLILLLRHSQALGTPLALVSQDPDVCYYAPRLGIPVYKSLRKAQNTHWRVPRRYRREQGEDTTSSLLKAGHENEALKRLHDRRLSLQPEPTVSRLVPIVRLAFFTLGVAALLAIAALLLPSAQITLAPQIRSQEVTIEVTAHSSVKEINLSGMLPAYPITITLEGRDSLPVSGSMWLPDHPATGYIQFTNLTDQVIQVPEGTVVRSNGPEPARFAVIQGGAIPAGPGEAILLPSRSLQPGKEGNLPANSLVAIEGLLGTQTSATNPEPTQNGSDRNEPTAVETDRQKLLEQLQSSLEESALDELQKGLAEGDQLIPSSVTLVQTVEERFQPEGKQPADHLELSLRQVYQALKISAFDADMLARQVLDANLPAGYTPVNGAPEVESITPPVMGTDAATRWKLRARRQLQAQVPEPQAIQLAIGLAPQQAQSRLQSGLALAGPPQIRLFPAWWPRLPFLPFRITIVNQLPGQPGT